MKQRNRCIVCGNKKHRDFAIEDGHAIYQCPQCDLVFSSDIPDLPFQRDENPQYIYDLTAELRIDLYKFILSHISKYKPSGKILDVGCRSGNFLELLSGNYNAQGIDISQKFIDYCKNKRLNAISGTLEKCDFSDETFEVISYLAVFEHIIYPDKELDEIKRVLRKDGILILEVPNLDFWAIKTKILNAIGKKAGLMPLNHIFYYNLPCLRRFMEIHDFDVIDYFYYYSIEGCTNANSTMIYELICKNVKKFPFIAKFLLNELIIIGRRR